MRLDYLIRGSNTRDPTLTNWAIVLSAQVVQNLSIITACIPYLKPLLESLESGMIGNNDIRRLGDTPGDTMGSGSRGYDSTKMSNISSKPKPSESTSTSGGSATRPTTANGVMTSGGQDEAEDWDCESQRSSSRIIKTTRTGDVGRS